MEVKFFKVTALPGTLQANAWYLVANSNYAETYITDNSGVAKMVGNSTMINDIITTRLAGLEGGSPETPIVADITARNALAATLESNTFVQVIDATGDNTVSSGGATYLFDAVNDTWIKVAEFESMDATLSWANISGRPTSSAAQIDSAVTNAHTHSNKTQLDLYNATGGVATYNGVEIKGWNEASW